MQSSLLFILNIAIHSYQTLFCTNKPLYIFCCDYITVKPNCLPFDRYLDTKRYLLTNCTLYICLISGIAMHISIFLYQNTDWFCYVDPIDVKPNCLSFDRNLDSHFYTHLIYFIRSSFFNCVLGIEYDGSFRNS